MIIAVDNCGRDCVRQRHRNDRREAPRRRHEISSCSWDALVMLLPLRSRHRVLLRQRGLLRLRPLRRLGLGRRRERRRCQRLHARFDLELALHVVICCEASSASKVQARNKQAPGSLSPGKLNGTDTIADNERVCERPGALGA